MKLSRRWVRIGALVVAALVVLVGLLTATVAIPVYRDLSAARGILEESPGDLSSDAIDSAASHIRSAADRLDSTAARSLRLLPLVGANLDAVDAAATDLLGVTDSAASLQTRFEDVEAEGLLAGGAVRLDSLSSLEEPLTQQADALGHLIASLGSHRTGALIPPLWTALDELRQRASELEEAAQEGGRLLAVVDALLGAEEPRTYLVALINNAELRGAGGVLTGIGTLTARDGRLELGQLFDHLVFSRSGPIVEVPASDEYVARYGEFKANTTLTLNATFSPDVPDVATVAAGIFEAVMGERADGVLMADPRGLAALMPPAHEIRVTGTDATIDKDSLARFVYSEAYDLFEDQTRRRLALLEVGREVFQATLSDGLRDRESLAAAADAFAGGHLRFVSFDPAEQEALTAAGATGDLLPPSGDSFLVVAQNFGTTRAGGTKLDYWAERKLVHHCDLKGGGAACSSTVTISNIAPDGLTRYVAGSPYGLMRDYIEVYVPGDARLLYIEENGKPIEYRVEGQSRHRVVSVFAEIARGESVTIEVGYELTTIDTDSGYTLLASPQPLARDASVEITVDAPDGWVVEGRGASGGNDYEFQGPFTGPLRVTAFPDERTGLPWLWERLKFWE